jgi:hypothetical protein
MGAMRKSLFGLVAAGTLLGSAVSALAGGPMVLTNRQLDSVTAGFAIVGSSADAQATGVLSLTGTTSNSVVVGGVAPFPGQPGLIDNAGFADATAVGQGTNLAQSGEPPASSGTAVTTTGAAAGNQVFTSTFNYTVKGAGGMTAQVGWTFVYGAWVL